MPLSFRIYQLMDGPTFENKATFTDPDQYSQGLKYVFVNGEVAVEDNIHKSNILGMIIYGPGKK